MELKMNIAEVEGIGPAFAEKLGAVGVSTVGDLLEKGASPEGRESLAEASGISEAMIRDWVNHADLMRINGVGPQFAEMLEASGVDSIPELAQRNAANLATKLDEVNAAKNLANRTPSLSEVERWIEEAKTMPRIVTH
jgi:predicted flap endonuclease-1-like 5' DNA nuclease